MSLLSPLPNEELGRAAIKHAIHGIALALAMCSWFYLGWFVALLLTILIALATIAARVTAALMVSEESFESIGSTVGRGIGSVMNLFSRKS